MRKRSVRLAVGVGIACVLAAGAIVAAVTTFSGHSSARSEGHELAVSNGFAPALARHLAKLKEALPGNQGEPGEGPGAADAAAIEALAFPDTDIPLARLEGARAAFTAVKARGFPNGKGRSGTWVSVGPSTALYPFFAPRDISLYVPNEYIAASRIDAMAIAPDCRPGHCRLWIGPAGGGIWRTDNALADTPSWTYLSGSYDINSIGAIALDPSDPSGNTLWVGTGEGNTCGSGCVHGEGLYKSTDGGDTWSGPLGKSAFAGRGIG